MHTTILIGSLLLARQLPQHVPDRYATDVVEHAAWPRSGEAFATWKGPWTRHYPGLYDHRYITW